MSGYWNSRLFDMSGLWENKIAIMCFGDCEPGNADVVHLVKWRMRVCEV